MDARNEDLLQSRLESWRAYAAARTDLEHSRLEELEANLVRDADALVRSGLSADEAFLVALKRAAERDAVLGEFMRAHAQDLLTSPVDDAAVPRPAHADNTRDAREFLVMLGCAVAAAAAIKIPALFGYAIDGDASLVYVLNLSLFCLPFLVAFFAWKRRGRLPRRQLGGVAAVFVAGGIIANVYPFVAGGSTQMLTAIHLPIVLWLAVGVVAAGGAWRSTPGRMEFTRFTGEWFVTYVLIALGGGVLSALTVGVFEAIGLDAEPFVSNWLIPCGAMGAVVVAAWLVEARRDMVGGFAPMLARVFTPLFAVMLIALLVGVAWTGDLIGADREVLILFDLLLVLVLAMLLYTISARDPHAPAGLFDRIQLGLLASALIVDVYALASIAARLGAYGFSANKTAALGLNVILLVNLAWSAWLQTGAIRSRRSFADVESWQMRYLPVYAIWAAIVVVVFPPLFGFA